MFPRTAILLSRLLPDAVITIVEGNARSIAAAQPYLPDGTAIDHRTFSGASEDGADLIVIPLSFRGDRRALYRNPPASLVLVHDWIWAPRGESVVVSRRLLKRLNLVRRQNA
jgi:hypothetical protein